MKRLRVFCLFASILIGGMLFPRTSAAPDIEIKATTNSYNNNTIGFYLSAQHVTIDWGDGKIDESTPSGIKKSFTHEYSNPDLQTIKINAIGITLFEVIDNGVGGLFPRIEN
jgi:uncharacterized protein YycO